MAENITVVSENRNLRAKPFIPGDDQLSTGNLWEEWLEGIEREFRFFRITYSIDKKDAMIIYGGREIARLEKSLPDSSTGGLDDYQRLQEKLSSYFAPKENKHYARYIFLKMRPYHSESTTAFTTRLREKANDCEFENEDDRIQEHIIQTTENQSLIKKTLNRKWTFSKMLQEVHQLEDTSVQIHDMKERHESRDIAKVQNTVNYSNINSYKCQPRHKNKNRHRHEIDKAIKQCTFCGKKHATQRREDCPAFGKQCNNCHRMNHFAVACTRKKEYNDNRQYMKYRNDGRGRNRDIRKTAEKSSDEESDTGSDNEFFGRVVHHLETIIKIQVNKVSDHAKAVNVVLNDVHVKMEPDSGTDVNVMDVYQYKAYRHRTRQPTSLKTSDTKLSTFQNSLPVKGEFSAIVRNETRGVETKFIVLKGRIFAPPLLGRTTLIELGMLQIAPNGSFNNQIT